MEIDTAKSTLEERIDNFFDLSKQRNNNLMDRDNLRLFEKPLIDFVSLIYLIDKKLTKYYNLFKDSYSNNILNVAAKYTLYDLEKNRLLNKGKVNVRRKYTSSGLYQVLLLSENESINKFVMDFASFYFDNVLFSKQNNKTNNLLLEDAENIFRSIEDISYNNIKLRKSDEELTVFIDSVSFTTRQHKKHSVEKNLNNYSWEFFGGYKKVVSTLKDISFFINHYEEIRDYVPPERVIPKGLLLVGPPGTGKSYLSQIFCLNSKIPFYSISPSDISSTYTMGLTVNFRSKLSGLQDIMQDKHSNFGLFYIDELDSIAQRRGSEHSVERDTFVTTLNSFMDGPESVPGLIFMASTNRLETIDPALLRPGRFRVLYMGVPNVEEAKEIFEAQLKRRRAQVKYSCYTESFLDKGKEFISKNYDNLWTGAFINELLNILETNLIKKHINYGTEFSAKDYDLLNVYNTLRGER